MTPQQLWFREALWGFWLGLLACVLPLLVLEVGSNHLYLFGPIFFFAQSRFLLVMATAASGKMQLSLQGTGVL